MDTTCLPEATTRTKSLNVLFLFDPNLTEENSAYDQLRSFRLLSRHNVFYAHQLSQHAAASCLEPFDVVVLHQSLARGESWLAAPLAAALEQYQGVKAVFLQDEYQKPEGTTDWCRRLGLQLAFTTLADGKLRHAYAELLAGVVFVTVPARSLPLGLYTGANGDRPPLGEVVRLFDDAIDARVARRRCYELTAALVLSADARGRIVTLDQAGIYTEPIGRATMAAVAQKTTVTDCLGNCQGRLSTQPGIPVTSANTAEAKCLYFAPYNGNRITLFNGHTWESLAFNDLALELEDLVRPSVNYDVFVGKEHGILGLELAAWADDHHRHTPLDVHDGVLVQGDDPTRRYVGTIRGSGPGMIEDSIGKRFIWNHYNQVPKQLYASDMAEHVYGSLEPRPWNNHPGVRFNFVLGQPTLVQVHCNAFLMANQPGAPALIYATLDGALEVLPELGRFVGNYNAHFIAASTSGCKLLEPGFHHIGAAECSSPAGATFGSVWLRGSIDC